MSSTVALQNRRASSASPEHEVVKTLVMQTDRGDPFIILMHGDRSVVTAIWRGRSASSRCSHARRPMPSATPGYLVGGTSPFGTRKPLPAYVEASALVLPRILINGGRRGFLIGIAPACSARCSRRTRALRVVTTPRRRGRIGAASQPPRCPSCIPSSPRSSPT
jgi:Cys-tRNA(Pro) deacylase